MTHPIRLILELAENYQSLAVKLDVYNEYAINNPLDSTSINRFNSVIETVETIDDILESLEQFYDISESGGYLFDLSALHHELSQLLSFYDPEDPGDQTERALQSAEEALPLVGILKNGAMTQISLIDMKLTDSTSDLGTVEIGTKTVHVKIKSQVFIDLLEQLEKFRSADEHRPTDNLEALPLSSAELEILRYSLQIAARISELPNWSVGIQKQIKGVAAVLDELAPFVRPISKPVAKAWDSAIHGLREALRALLTDGESS